MIRKKHGFRTFMWICAGAAVGVAVYKYRDRINGFIDELTGNAAEDYAPEAEAGIEISDAREADIVIDRSGEPEAEAPADAPEEAPAEQPEDAAPADAPEEAPAGQPEDGAEG